MPRNPVPAAASRAAALSAEGGPLPLEDFLGVLASAEAFLGRDDTPWPILQLPAEGTLCVGSDLHGSLDALRHVLAIAGWPWAPGDGRCLLLLGDYVDRGRDSVLLLAFLLVLLMEHPDRVFLLRGNHEGPYIGSRVAALRRELRERYGRRGAAEAYRACQRVFELLPVVAVSGNGLVAMHGGSPKSPRIAGLTRAVLHDILWADLHRRGRKGRKWLEHDLDHFLAEAGKSVILRGHRHAVRGVELFGPHVLTIISANVLRRFSVFLGRKHQRGAVLVPLDADLENATQMEIRLF